MVATYNVLGKPIGRYEGPDKVTGAAKYTADVILPGTLIGKTLKSPYAHARIVKIDTAAANALPGVHAVITGADVPETLDRGASEIDANSASNDGYGFQ